MGNLFSVVFISILAAISPGPDFVIVMRNSLSYSRKAGMMSALGISLALLIHLSYTLVGIGVLIAESPLLFQLIQYVGAFYLGYLGVKGVYHSFAAHSSWQFQKKPEDLLPLRSFLKQGFLTNLLNPKCTLFFMSLFSQFITSEIPWYVRGIYFGINWAIVFGWFLLLAYLVTGSVFFSKVQAFRIYIERVMGLALILLALKLIFFM